MAQRTVTWQVSFVPDEFCEAKGWIDDPAYGVMRFDVRKTGDAFQCFNCGNDSTPLAYNEAIVCGDPVFSVWLALPEEIRKSLVWKKMEN